MYPKFAQKKLEKADLGPFLADYLDIKECRSFVDLQAYAVHCVEFSAFSAVYHNIRPAVASLHVQYGTFNIDDWRIVLDAIYLHGGSILLLDTQQQKSSIALVKHVTTLAAQYQRSCVNISLRGILRSEAHLDACFPRRVPSIASPGAGVAAAFEGIAADSETICTTCKTLDLSDNKLRDAQTQRVLASLFSENSVGHLRLDSNSIGTSACDVLCRWLTSDACSLRFLSMRDCGIFSDRPLRLAGRPKGSDELAVAGTFGSISEKLAHALSLNGALDELELGGIPSSFVESGSLERCLHVLCRNSTLKSLDLSGDIALSTDLLAPISRMLDSSYQLVNLNLSFCGLSNESVALLCSTLGETRKLMSLGLAVNDFHDLRPLFPLLKKQLRWLDVSGNKFVVENSFRVSGANDEEERALEEARSYAERSAGLTLFLGRVARSSSLRHLNMDSCQLQSTSIAVLFYQLAVKWAKCGPGDVPKDNGRSINGDNATVLSYLSLNSNPIGYKGVRYCAAVLEKYHRCHSIRHLRLSKTMGGSTYEHMIKGFLKVDRRLVTLELSREEVLMADTGRVLPTISSSISSSMAPTAEGNSSELGEDIPLITHCSAERQPIITVISAPLSVRVGFISAIRNPQNGRLSLPRDAIHSILLFLRIPIQRKVILN